MRQFREGQRMTYQEKLKAAKEYLGFKWVFHPLYRPENNPAHRFKGSYYMAKYRRVAEMQGRL